MPLPLKTIWHLLILTNVNFVGNAHRFVPQMPSLKKIFHHGKLRLKKKKSVILQNK
jgi:hypothetical protein